MKRFITLLAAALMSVGMSWAMQIYIDVPEQDLLAIDVEPSDGIENVKGKIQDKTSIPPEYQTLYFNSTLLEDDRSLADYNILEESTLQLAISGGSTPTTWTSLSVGDVIKVGDKIEVPAEGDGSWGINGYVLRNTWGPYELIRADIYQESVFDDPVVTETEDGAFYVFKAENNDFYPLSDLAKGEGLVVTATSDGLEVTVAENKEFTVAVHEKADDPTTYTLTVASNDVAMGTVTVEGAGSGAGVGEIESIELSNIPAEWANNTTLLSADDLPGFVAVTGEEALALAADLNITTGIIVYGFEGESVATVQIYHDYKLLQDVPYTKEIIADLPSIPTQIFYTGVPVSTDIVDNGDGTYTVAEGIEVTIVAQPAEGYHLASWSNDAALNENDSQTITITDNTTVTAVFAANVVTPVANVDAENAETEVWFDLSGRRLQSKPSTPGLYIRNGKKALVK
ncbi:MAG: hypothetical protein IKR17_01420 [Bacteroidales bacterium]|nr:hypothetical protein [Bacteroidales bacterium]